MRVLKSENINYLNLIPFSNFSLWDTKRYTNVINLNLKNKISLKEILFPFKKAVTKENAIKEKLNIISKINFSGQLFLRDFEEIHDYKGNLYFVPKNSIIYSKINVRHGCIYYNSSNDDVFLVSNEYPVFTFDDKKVNGVFLKTILRSNIFKTLLNTKATGISKARVKQDEFLDIEIPLPSIEEQNKIVASYNAKLLLAQQQEEQAKTLESEIERYLFEELGIEKTEKNIKKIGLQFVKYNQLNRWDVWVNRKQNNSSKFKLTTLSEIVIGKPFYGANVKGIKKKSDTRYIRITDINETGDLNDDFVSPEIVDEKYLLKENDFLIARSGNTVGKTFLYKDIYGRCMFAGYLVKYNIDYNKILPEYLLFFSKSETFKNWIASNQRVAGQPNINGQEFLNAPLLLPPIDIQKKIILNVNHIRNQIKELNTLSAKNKEEAIVEFEKEIFN